MNLIFDVGDRVVSTGVDPFGPAEGIMGTVVTLNPRDISGLSYGVAWDKFNRGHDLNRMLAPTACHGRWHSEKHMLRVEEVAVQIDVTSLSDLI